MAFEAIGYHGTSRKNARGIMASGFDFNCSSKDVDERTDWQGQGAYFFVEVFHAYYWIRSQCSREYPDQSFRSSGHKFYCILRSQLQTHEDRIFDLDTVEHKRIFERTVLKILEKLPDLDIKDDGAAIACKTFNFLFQTLGYLERYDIVIGVYERHKFKYHNVACELLPSQPQKIMCVKNINIIKNTIYYDYQSQISKLEELVSYYKSKSNIYVNNCWNYSTKYK